MPLVLRKLNTLKCLPEENAKAKINPHQGINRLPFDCFFLIFGRSDLRTQILDLRTVCHIWHDHIAQMCASKSQLNLKPYVKPFNANQYNPYRNITKDQFFIHNLQQYFQNRESYSSDLEFRLPKLTKFNFTTNSFVNHSSLFSLFGDTLTELNLTFARNYYSENINVANFDKLMNSLTGFINLRTFKLYISRVLIREFDREKTQTTPSLYKKVSDCLTRQKFPTLTHLDLSMDCHLIDISKLNLEMCLDPQLLSQLEHFLINFHTRRVPVLIGQLNPNLTFLSFNCNLLPSKYDEPKLRQLDPALLGEPQFGPSLTHLRLNEVWHLPLKLFCDRFTSLQSIQLQNNQKNFDQKWIKPLNQLEQLVELQLDGFKIHVFPDNSFMELESRCLLRVKKLTWNCCWLLDDFSEKFCADQTFDGELFCRTLARQFTNLEELVMLTREANEHVQQVRDQLCHFKKLQTIFLDFNV